MNHADKRNPGWLFNSGKYVLSIISLTKPLESWLKRYKNKSWVKYVPNAITLFRLPLTLTSLGLYAYAIYSADVNLAWISIICGFIALISDFWDGFLARLWDVESEKGMIWDPVVDKIFTYPSIFGFTYLIYLNYFSLFFFVNLILALLLICLEVILAWLNIQNKKINFGTKNMAGASNDGKIKFTIECLMIFVLAIANIPGYNTYINTNFLNLIFLTGLLFSVYFANLSRIGYKKRLNMAQTI